MITILVICPSRFAFGNPESVEQERTPQELCEFCAKEDGVMDEDYPGSLQDSISSFEDVPGQHGYKQYERGESARTLRAIASSKRTGTGASVTVFLIPVFDR